MSTKKLQVLNFPQSDWNQTDEKSSDYIKNKPDIDGIADGLQTSIDELREYVDGRISETPALDGYTKTEVDVFLEGKANTDHNHDDKYDAIGSAEEALKIANVYTDNAVAQKSQVQIISTNETENITENLATLKIHKLSKEQYEEELANGNIDENVLYLTPEEEYYTVDEIDEKISVVNSSISEVESYADTKCELILEESQTYTDNAISQKSLVQIIAWEEDD